jgi:hypothetical protein
MDGVSICQRLPEGFNQSAHPMRKMEQNAWFRDTFIWMKWLAAPLPCIL